MVRSSDPLWPRAGDWAAGVIGAWSDVSLIGIPTWRTSLSPTRAFETPKAVRAALRFYSEWSPDSPRALRVVDVGDIDAPDAPAGEPAAIESVRAAAAHSGLLVALGGDNAATVSAALGTWGDRIGTAGLVTLDAHHDLRDGLSNGSPARRLIEAGLDGTRVVQVGIADFANSAEYAARAADLGIHVIRRTALAERPIADAMAEALSIAASAGGPVHVDVDVDVCDRSVAPACPASVPGGISAFELRSAVRAAGEHPAVRSVDFTEVDATADAPDGRTVRLVALGVLEVIAAYGRRP